MHVLSTAVDWSWTSMVTELFEVPHYDPVYPFHVPGAARNEARKMCQGRVM